MYKNSNENIEVYFICNKKGKMELVETYYDPITETHSWYFNAYLAYKYWQKDFKNITSEIGEMTKALLTVAASRYIIYKLEEKKYKDKKEKEKLIKELSQIDPELEEIIINNPIISNL